MHKMLRMNFMMWYLVTLLMVLAECTKKHDLRTEKRNGKSLWYTYDLVRSGNDFPGIYLKPSSTLEQNKKSINNGYQLLYFAPIQSLQRKEHEKWLTHLPSALQAQHLSAQSSFRKKSIKSSKPKIFHVPLVWSTQDHANIWNFDLEALKSNGKKWSQTKVSGSELPTEQISPYSTGKMKNEKKIICAFSSWAWFRKGKGSFVPEHINPSLCTHIIYAFGKLEQSNYSLIESDPWTDNRNGFYERVIDLKKLNPDLKVMLGMGGWSDSGDDKYSKLAHSTELCKKFALQAADFLQTRGFDGLSVDWQYPRCWQSNCQAGPASDKQAFSKLLKELNQVFKPKGLLLSATVSGYKEVIDLAYDVPYVSKTVDFMNIMSYDYHGSWESKTGHISPLFKGPQASDPFPQYNANFTINYYISKGAERSKLILGIPFYGQTFTLAHEQDSTVGSEAIGPGKAGKFTQQPGMLAYYEICGKVKRSNWKKVQDLTGSWGPYAHHKNQWVGYDDPATVARKARFVKTERLGGIFAWTMDLDDFNNDCCMGSHPLLKTLGKELMGSQYDYTSLDCRRPPPVVTPAPKPPSSSTTDGDWMTSTTSSNPNWTSHPSSTTESHGLPSTSSLPPLPPSAGVAGNDDIIAGGSCSGDWIYKPDTRSCKNYFQCINMKVHRRACPNGLHWNQFIGSCDWPKNAKCQNQAVSSTTLVPNTSAATIAPATSSTSSSVFTPTSSASTCRNGAYYKGPTCSQYYICVNGEKLMQTCAPGLHWNMNKNLCDWPDSANCVSPDDDAVILNIVGPAPPKKLLSSPSPQTPPISESSNQIEVELDQSPITIQEGCRQGSYASSVDNCAAYFVCNHGKLLKFTCHNGLFWNHFQKTCDWPHNVDCGNSEANSIEKSSQEPSGSQMESDSSFISSVTQKVTEQIISTTAPIISSTDSFQSSSSSSTTKPVTSSKEISESGYKVVCYYTNWSWYRERRGKYSPEDIDSDLCTHIIYSFAILDPVSLTIKVHDAWADIDNKFYEKVTKLKSKGKKVLIAIGGWNDSAGDKYSRLVSNPSSRKGFIKNVLQFMQKHNFDGLDLDWEYPKCWQVQCDKGPASDKANFGHFVKELKQAFEPKGYMLSAAVSPSKWVIDQGYDIPTISKYLDWISVMTYDFHGHWDKETGHVSPLFFHEEADSFYLHTNYSIKHWISKGADVKKIVMGLPMYGQSFTLRNPSQHGLHAPTLGPGEKGEYTKASGFLSYYEICENIQRRGWKVVEDPTGAIGPYAYKGNQWVSFDDPKMARKKANHIKKLGLAGAMVWAIDLDDFNNICGGGKYPLLTEINEGLKGTLKKPALHVSNEDENSEENQLLAAAAENFIPQQVNLIEPIQQVLPTGMELCVKHPFKENPKDCTRYFQCVFGRFVEHKCPRGTFWNKDRCDWTCGSANDNVENFLEDISSHASSTRRPQTTSSSTQNFNSKKTTRKPTSTTALAEWTPTKYVPWKPPLVTTTTILPIDVPKSDKKIICYFTNWSWYRQGIGKYKPEDIDFNLCTHILYAFAVLDPSTYEIRPHDTWSDVDNHFFVQVTKLRTFGKKVLIALGGWNDSRGDKYSKMVNDAKKRARFISSILRFIEKWKFDGLDLDWEYPKCWQTKCSKGPNSDKKMFGLLVKELYDAFQPKGYLLSAAVSPSKVIIDEGYDVPMLNKYLDWIAVMSYDYHGQWDKKTGHISPLYDYEESENKHFNSNYSINYWIQRGASKEKIMMGLPMYGQSFTLESKSEHGLNAPSYSGGTAGKYTKAKGFLSYYEICQKVKKSKWEVVYDPSGSIGPYAYKGNQWVSFDDVAMVKKKSQYINDMGLGGAMIWALDLDDFRGICSCEKHPLLKSINRVIRKFPEEEPQCSLTL